MPVTHDAQAVARCTASFSDRRVLVLGDAILDEYLLGECARISPEAPVPVLRVTRSRHVLGGAANTAANIVALGGQATLVALVGDDEGGRMLRQCARDSGVELLAIDAGVRTIRKTRVIGQQQQVVRLDYEDTRAGSPATDAQILSAVSECLSGSDIVVISDYAKGFLSFSLARDIIAQAHKAGRPVVVDPRPQNRECYRGCDYITPNWREAQDLLGIPVAESTPESVSSTSATLAAALGCHVVLTLGHDGIAFCSRDHSEQFSRPTLAREVFDVSGAGDTVVATFALARASGADHPLAVDLANRAASVVVGKFGTATVSRDEILFDTQMSRRLVPRSGLSLLADSLRAKGLRIVTVNGDFETLHAGHLHTLSEARRQGDVLIVGLSAGPSKPGRRERMRVDASGRCRAEMLLALRMVDFVHVFDETDAIAFVREIRPDVHVTGFEHRANTAENDAVVRQGGAIYIVNPMPGHSAGSMNAIFAGG